METIKMEIPVSFKWVIEQMLKWKQEQINRNYLYIYKDGGICAIKRIEETEILTPK